MRQLFGMLLLSFGLAMLVAALGASTVEASTLVRSQSLPAPDRALVVRLAEKVREPTIVGGSPATPGEYPWMASVLLAFPDGADPDTDIDIFECAGSLIGESWVLTAGHCVLDEAGNPTATGAIAIIGANDVTTAPDELVYDADLIVQFGFDPVTGDNDLALLRLVRPAPDQGIVLVRPGQEDLFAPGTLATIAGWGVTQEEGSPSNVLLEAQVPIVDDATCGNLLPGLFSPLTNICAGFPQGGVDSCQGDSGGPLMVPNGFGGFAQAGIVSNGVGCALPNLPGIYTRVATYSEQIVSALKGQQVAAVGDPSARTNRASKVKRRSAQVNGTVDPNGLAAHAFMELGRTRSYGRVVESYVGSAHEDVSVNTVFSGLKRNKVYHFRVSVLTSAGLFVGADRTLRTKR